MARNKYPTRYRERMMMYAKFKIDSTLCRCRSQSALRLDRRWLNASLGLLNQAQHVSCAAEGEGEPRAALSVRVDDMAERSVRLLPQLTLDPYVLTAHGTQALNDWLCIELSVRESRHELVAANAHAAHLGAVNGQVKVALVGLGDTCIDRNC